jgi:pyridoxine 5-phosphate synthase
VIDAVRTCIDAGAPGITVHPRADERHIRVSDVHDIAGELAPLKGRVEFNIEGDPRPGLVDLVLAVKPDQCTLVPVKPGEITSEAGWPADTPAATLAGVIGAMRAAGIRVSLFVDPAPAAIHWAKSMGADRVELYTEPFARAFERGPDAAAASFERYAAASRLAHDNGLGVNAGHDLDLRNLTLFKTLPHLDEVSIGHALISRAIFVGLSRVVREYLAILSALVLAVSCLAAPAAAAGRAVTFSSSDGTTLAGEIYEAASRPSPGVVFVHMLSRSRADWRELPDRVREAGITALTIDLRGHGGSGGSAADLAVMVQDVQAAVSWLASRPNVRPDAIAIVGASLGASLALLAAVDLPQVRAVGAVSPSLDYRGLRTDVALVKRLGPRSLWLAASAEDPLALRTLRDMAAEPSGPREQLVSTAVAHGTVLLDRDADAARTLVDWLRRSLLS